MMDDEPILATQDAVEGASASEELVTITKSELERLHQLAAEAKVAPLGGRTRFEAGGRGRRSWIDRAVVEGAGRSGSQDQRVGSGLPRIGARSRIGGGAAGRGAGGRRGGAVDQALARRIRCV